MSWTAYAPAFIIAQVALLSYVSLRRSTLDLGWYTLIKQPPLSPALWLFILIWILLYLFQAIIWYRVNSSITDTSLFFYVNLFLTLNITLNLAWFCFFFGDANFLAGIIILSLTLITIIILFYLLFNDIWALVYLSLYFIVICYFLYINISMFISNSNTLINCGSYF